MVTFSILVCNMTMYLYETKDGVKISVERLKSYENKHVFTIDLFYLFGIKADAHKDGE